MRLSDVLFLWHKLRYRGALTIGRKSRIEMGAVINLRDGGTVNIGDSCRLRRGAMLIPYGGKIRIGSNFSLNPNAILYGHGGLTIGDGVRIAAGTVIVPANHVFSDPDKPIRSQGVTCEGIVIEDDVWIGANVTVLDGAHISRGCVIAAGSVVRGKTEPMGVYGGVPAKLLKWRKAPESMPHD